MTLRKKLSVLLITIFTLGIMASCTPEEIATFNTLNPDEQAAVIAGLQGRGSGQSRDCYEAIDKHFSGDKANMKKIVWRESRNNPTVKNPKSTASGCAQMLKMHDWRFAEVGCSPSQKFEPDCNVKAADHLYRQAGWSPWKLTDY